MHSSRPRRAFLSAALSTAAAALLPRAAAWASAHQSKPHDDRLHVRPFDLSAVRLSPGTVFDAMRKVAGRQV
jgi:hypothetical protein